jgi:hypothetical protein
MAWQRHEARGERRRNARGPAWGRAAAQDVVEHPRRATERWRRRTLVRRGVAALTAGRHGWWTALPIDTAWHYLASIGPYSGRYLGTVALSGMARQCRACHIVLCPAVPCQCRVRRPSWPCIPRKLELREKWFEPLWFSGQLRCLDFFILFQSLFQMILNQFWISVKSTLYNKSNGPACTLKHVPSFMMNYK